MSQTSTIAIQETPTREGFSFKGAATVFAALVAGAVIGIVVANSTTTTELPTASATATATVSGLALDDFIRLNTTSFDGLAPVAAVTAAGTASTDDRFLEINTTSYDYLNRAISSGALQSQDAVAREFWYLNVTSLEYPTGQYSEPSSGLR